MWINWRKTETHRHIVTIGRHIEQTQETLYVKPMFLLFLCGKNSESSEHRKAPCFPGHFLHLGGYAGPHI